MSGPAARKYSLVTKNLRQEDDIGSDLLHAEKIIFRDLPTLDSEETLGRIMKLAVF